MELEKECDPMGQAIWDFAHKGKAGDLIVKSTMFDDDKMSVKNLFRTELEMPPLERLALDLCQGRVLDVGAGAGCHTLALQERGLKVTSIDISRLSTQVRQLRGDCLLSEFYFSTSFFKSLLQCFSFFLSNAFLNL